MRASLILVFILFLSIESAFATSIVGNVQKNWQNSNRNQLTDYYPNEPVENARISLPSKKYATTSDYNGEFDVPRNIDNATIMKIQKDGYKPFSLTVKQASVSTPMQLSIEKSKPNDIVLETSMVHLGDDTYSETSANSSEFQAKFAGPFSSNKFKVKSLKVDEDAYLVIGSIIGIDTMIARNLGQSRVKTAYASAPQVYFNGQKIAEIKVNGDRQEVKLPKTLIKENRENDVTIQTGRNLFQTDHVDYDDIEFTNLYL